MARTRQISKLLSIPWCLLLSAFIFRKRVKHYEIDPRALAVALKKKESVK